MNPDRFYSAIDATWPAAETAMVDPWLLRRGAGGGKRVSSATAHGSVQQPDVEQAVVAMDNWGQDPLFMIRPHDQELDALLAAQGYGIIDPTNVYSVAIERLTEVPLPRVTAFCIWEPLAIMCEIWAKGGIGPERIDVMERAHVKTGILARWNEKPAGAAFAAVDGDICMVHAVEVLPGQRRQGVAQWIMRAAAFWGQKHGASHMSVLCTAANRPANKLYSSLGFERVGHYHYRHKAA
ncbi:MAG: GNAT family N-acetyltransferase [Paracoccaceae bacterium]|nr:GNAT family N-acetyltransferase [Paracoccaceae bacterium]